MKPASKAQAIIKDWVISILQALLIAGFIIAFIAQAFKIPSSSMENTLLIGDHLFVNKFIYGRKYLSPGQKYCRR